MSLRAGALSQEQGDEDRGVRDALHQRCHCWPRQAPGQRWPSEQGPQEPSRLEALLARTPSVPAPVVTAWALWVTLCAGAGVAGTSFSACA